MRLIKAVVLAAAGFMLAASPAMATQIRTYIDVKTATADGDVKIRSFDTFSLILERRGGGCTVWMRFRPDALPLRLTTFAGPPTDRVEQPRGPNFREVLSAPLITDGEQNSHGDGFATSKLVDVEWLGRSREYVHLLRGNLVALPNRCVSATLVRHTPRLDYLHRIDTASVADVGDEANVRGYPYADPVFLLTLEYAPAGTALSPGLGFGPGSPLQADTCILWLQLNKRMLQIGPFEETDDGRVPLAWAGNPLGDLTEPPAHEWNSVDGETFRMVSGLVSKTPDGCRVSAMTDYANSVLDFYR
jgi:hypothetical protein